MSPQPSLRIIFFGSGEFALPALEHLHTSGPRYRLLRVVSRPRRAAGRGKKLRSTPIEQRAGELGIPCDTPGSANSAAFLERLAAHDADLFLVADYGELLGRRFRELPRIGVFNLHASLLPRYRGAAPVVHALLGGEKRTGVTLFRIERGLDSGPIVAMKEAAVRDLETAGELESRLAHLAAELLAEQLEAFADGSFTETPQDHSQATLAPKVHKKAALLDWQRRGEVVCAAVRAYNPWPGAYSFLVRANAAPERTVFLRVRPSGRGQAVAGACPGTVTRVERESFNVACQGGSVEVLEIQRAGKAALSAAAYLRGRRLQSGSVFTHHGATAPGPS